MIKCLLKIYNWLGRRKWVLYSSLILVVALCVTIATQIKLEENIYSFFGEDELAFKNLKFKDKIVVEVTGTNPDSLVMTADAFTEKIVALQQNGMIGEVVSTIDESQFFQAADYIYSFLPIFIDDDYYQHIDTLISDTAIAASIDNSLNMILSPGGMVMKDFIVRDPLNIGTPILSNFQRFNSNDDYEIYSSHLFNKDYSSLYIFITPIFDMGNTGDNEELVTLLENVADEVSTTEADITCFGGHIIAVHNARQVKKDTILTLVIAFLIIIVVIFFAFKNKWSIPLIIIPPIFGALFALALIVIIKGSVSAIAIGLGSIVLGVALSYSIHVIAHANHICSTEKIITDLAYPLTVGCITTIGAFVALLFTSSQLLRDLGLFAALSLVGTTIFCLIYVPHFIKPAGDNTNRFLNFIERCNAYDYEDNKCIIAVVTLLTVVCLFFYNDVQFDSDLNSINYVPDKIKVAEEKMQKSFAKEANKIYLISSVSDNEWSGFVRLNEVCDSLTDDSRKLLDNFVSLNGLVIPYDIQRQRIEKWNNYWTKEKIEATISKINNYARLNGFSENAFQSFFQILTAEYDVCEYNDSVMASVPIISDRISQEGDNLYLVSSIEVNDKDKEHLYSIIKDVQGVTIVDRAYFSSKMIEDISDDFNLILWISSLLVFVTLLVIYGRLEVALLTFLPMCVSWVIILGLMSIFGIKFNIVNIILATLIFGIGDDFSIFIMDGLQQEYRSGTKILGMHKTAIFFSAFTTIVGIGVLILAKHPAMRSIAILSMIGICVVVVVAYTIQPFLFRLLVVNPAGKGNFPITIKSFLCSIIPFFIFFIGCIIGQILILILTLLPIKREKKQLIIHSFIQLVAKVVLGSAFHVKFDKRNYTQDILSKPAIIVANHKSFIDVLLLMTFSPKIVFVTSDWVWKSPLFGFVLKYAGYLSANEGYENIDSELVSVVERGYSIAIFPEGTRSFDEQILRFHKGAFYLSEKLRLDVLPVVIYGAGAVLSKQQNLYLKPGVVCYEFLPRISFDDKSFGDTYQQRCKAVRKLIVDKYTELHDEFTTPDAKYYREKLLYNYIYKGRDAELFIRRQLFEKEYFTVANKLVPFNGIISVINCGDGSLALMLSMMSKHRTIYAYDADKDNIDFANHCFAKSDKLSYFCTTNAMLEFYPSDCFIISNYEMYTKFEIETLLANCAKSLNNGGSIIVLLDRKGIQKQMCVSQIHNVIDAACVIDLKISTCTWHGEVCKYNESDISELESNIKVDKRHRYNYLILNR